LEAARWVSWWIDAQVLPLGHWLSGWTIIRKTEFAVGSVVSEGCGGGAGFRARELIVIWHVVNASAEAVWIAKL